ncbi:hypothetical protein Tco_1463861, partial [Tanacetum coccineum]
MDESTIKVHGSTLPGSVCLRTCLEPDVCIKDNGCSKHMTDNKSLFSTYKAYDGGFDEIEEFFLWMLSCQALNNLRITSGVRFHRRPTAKGVGLRMADSRTGNHSEDDFTPLKTIRRLYSVFRRRFHLGFEGETSEPKER